MPKLGDMPVSLVLTRDQVRLIRGMLATTAIRGELIPAFQDVKDVLDNAETQATIDHARSPQEIRERTEIAKVYGPALVDAVIRERKQAYIRHDEYMCLHYDDGCRCICADCRSTPAVRVELSNPDPGKTSRF
jgi:hypothetical protein